MSCNCTHTCNCPIQPCPSIYSPWFLRIGFGLAIAGYGINHYRNMEEFMGFAKGVFPTIPALGQLFGLLAYVLPALMILGGVLFAVKQLKCFSKIFILAALGGIIGWAGLAVMLGDASAGPNMMPAIQNAMMFLLAYYVIKKMSCCSCASLKHPAEMHVK